MFTPIEKPKLDKLDIYEGLCAFKHLVIPYALHKSSDLTACRN